ncbi:MAG: MlaD family protein [Spirochaetota bacterium]
MKERTNDVWIGVTVSVATLIVILGVLVIGRPGFFESGMRVDLRLQAAQGIEAGTEVFYRGVNAGSVTGTELDEEAVIVELKLSEIDRIPADSQFVVRSTDLLGGRSIHIVPGSEGEHLESGAVVEGTVEGGLMEMLGGDGELETQTQDVLSNLQRLSGEPVQQQVRSTLESLKTSSEELETLLSENRNRVGSVVTSLENITESSEEPVAEILENVRRDSEELSEAIEEARSTTQTLESLLSDIREGEGSIGRLVADDALYLKADAVLTRLDRLLADIEEDPSEFFSFSIF